MNETSCTSPAEGCDSLTHDIDASCRVPLFVLFCGAAVWLAMSSVFGLLASIRFHSPNFLAGCAWLTYGRVYPAATTALLYGFAIQAGLGVGLWIIARLGQTTVVAPWIISFGGKLWNLGLLVGLIGILRGDSTGFENFELPRYATVILFIAYAVIGACILLTLHNRREQHLQPAQWFLMAALFWFPWIFSTAHLLLSVFPVRGVTQSVIDWWYSANLKLVWLGLVGLATTFFMLSRLMNRALHSQYLALFTFWTIILFATWSGIPSSAPLPAWMPALSTIATVLTLTTVLAVGVNVYRTVGCGCSRTENPAPGKFVAFGVMAFALAWVMNVVASVRDFGVFTQFTWFTIAQSHLNVFGFFTMTMLGAIYYIVPRVTGIEWPCGNSVKAHYWLAAIGAVLLTGSLAVGGVLQGIKLNHSQVAFIDVARSTLHFLRISTMGELMILAGNLLLLGNLTRLSIRYYRQHFLPVYTEATAELKPSEVKP